MTMASRSAFVRLSSLRKLREPQQVAAVCYRASQQKIEFLLVQTRGSGRWTFPKGRTEAGLTHAQAAALEASEEAGVHGRIEEAAFAQYFCRKRNYNSKSRVKIKIKSGRAKIVVSAHLCEVTRLRTPKESNRNRTWFGAREARIRLQEGRSEDEAAEFARILDYALARIQRQRKSAQVIGEETTRRQIRDTDPLRKVQIESPSLGSRLSASGRTTSVAVGRSRTVLRGTILPFVPIEDQKLLPARKQVKSLRPRDV